MINFCSVLLMLFFVNAVLCSIIHYQPRAVKFLIKFSLIFISYTEYRSNMVILRLSFLLLVALRLRGYILQGYWRRQTCILKILCEMNVSAILNGPKMRLHFRKIAVLGKYSCKCEKNHEILMLGFTNIFVFVGVGQFHVQSITKKIFYHILCIFKLHKSEGFWLPNEKYDYIVMISFAQCLLLALLYHCTLWVRGIQASKPSFISVV